MTTGGQIPIEKHYRSLDCLQRWPVSTPTGFELAINTIFLKRVKLQIPKLLHIHGSDVHISIGVQTDPRKRVTLAIFKTVLLLR